jgi:pimeloyl-ACP methyl ester carboxylesterase
MTCRGPDGTKLRGWRTATPGPPVLLCPGLGTPPEAWPGLLAPDAEVRVHSWHYRGLLGSDRPADPGRITMADHVSDALAVLDEAGIEGPIVVLGWSMGAAVATELACRHPDRVGGLLLLGGAAGDMFGGMLGVLDAIGITVPARRALVFGAAQLVRAAGPLLTAITPRVPVNRTTAGLLRHSGLMRPTSPTDDVLRAAGAFLHHDWSWYATLALAAAGERVFGVDRLRLPLTVLTGRYDLLADPRHVLGPVAALPQARLRVLPTSHFIPFEAPDVLADELRALVARADAVHAALVMAGWANHAGPRGTHHPLTPTGLA